MKGLKASIQKSFSVEFLKIPKVGWRDSRLWEGRRNEKGFSTKERLTELPSSPGSLITVPISFSIQSVKDMTVSEYRQMVALGAANDGIPTRADVAALLEPIAPPPSTTRKRYERERVIERQRERRSK